MCVEKQPQQANQKNKNKKQTTAIYEPIIFLLFLSNHIHSPFPKKVLNNQNQFLLSLNLIIFVLKTPLPLLFCI